MVCFYSVGTFCWYILISLLENVGSIPSRIFYIRFIVLPKFPISDWLSFHPWSRDDNNFIWLRNQNLSSLGLDHPIHLITQFIWWSFVLLLIPLKDHVMMRLHKQFIGYTFLETLALLNKLVCEFESCTCHLPFIF